MVSVDVKHHVYFLKTLCSELRSCCAKVEVAPGLPVPNNPYDLCGSKAALKSVTLRAQRLYESQGGRPGLPIPVSPYGFCGRKATLNLVLLMQFLRLCLYHHSGVAIFLLIFLVLPN